MICIVTAAPNLSSFWTKQFFKRNAIFRPVRVRHIVGKYNQFNGIDSVP